MHTEFTVNSSDFANYNVQGNVQIAFNMKEFKVRPVDKEITGKHAGNEHFWLDGIIVC